MIITWLIPDTFGFLIDELEALAQQKNVTLRVLSGKPITDTVKKRLPLVEFYYCPPKSFAWTSIRLRLLDTLWRLHGWRLLRNGYHAHPIAGLYAVLQKLEAKQKSDVLHSHFAYPGGVGAGLVNQPQLLTLRGYDILTTGNYGSLWNFFFKKNIINFYSDKNIITCGSWYTATRARQILGSHADIRYIKEGLPSRNFHNANIFTKAQLNINKEATVLLSVGNLVDVKNHDLLLRVFAELIIQKKEPLHLLLCGDGPLRSQLEALSKSLHIANHVSFMGQINRAELSDVFKLSDIFVHTSMSEGFGNVIVEAMLFELLVVASPVGVAADIIDHKKNGYLPQLGDQESWVVCLKEAIESRAFFKDELINNKKIVTLEFTIEKRINALMELYKEAIENNSKPKNETNS